MTASQGGNKPFWEAGVQESVPAVIDFSFEDPPEYSLKDRKQGHNL